jgi:hypothetical protein
MLAANSYILHQATGRLSTHLFPERKLQKEKGQAREGVPAPGVKNGKRSKRTRTNLYQPKRTLNSKLRISAPIPTVKPNRLN